MTIFCGIDPGKDGGIAFVGDDITPVAYAAVVGAKKRRDLICQHENIKVCIEKSQAFPGQGSVSNHSTGMDYAQWLTILEVYDIPFQVVPVQTWQKVMLVGKPSPSGKPKNLHRKSIKAFAAIVAQRLFPGVDLKRTAACKGPHDGAVDALLIAEYCRRVWK